MPDFRVVRVELPGDWRDGWLYKDHLLLWTRSGTAYFLPLAGLLDTIERQADRPVNVLTECLLFRNDWKHGELFRKLLSVSGVAQAFLSAYPTDQEEVVIRLLDVPVEELPSETASGVALDTYLYANRVYIASTDGLFESYFDPNPSRRRVQRRYPTVQHLSMRTAKVSARYLSLNASTEDEGLWFAPITVGLNGSDDQLGTPSDGLGMRQVAEYSLAASFARRNLLNYKDSPTPGFLQAEAVRGRAHDRAAYDEWHVLNYGAERDIERLTSLALTMRGRVSMARAENSTVPLTESPPTVLGNSNYRMLIDWSEQLHVVDVFADPRKGIEALPDSKFAHLQLPRIPPDEVLAVYPIASGFLVELFSEVRLITPRGSYLLFRGGAARIRTFPQSRRYQDAALIVGEDSCSLVGFLEVEA